MRILLLTDNFVPETNSPALRAHEHARVWVAEGAKVTIITSIPNFPTGRPLPPYKNRLYQTEILDGIAVTRVWTYLAPNLGIVRRSIDFLSFAVSGFVAGLFTPADIVVATSPQLLTGLAGRWLAAVKRCPWVFEVRDLWPDSIVSVGVMRENWFIRLLHKMERSLYRSATKIVAVSNGIRDRLIARGVPPEKIAVIPNGVNLRRMEGSRKTTSLRENLKLADKFIVGYVGTHGMAQGLEVALEAAQRLAGSDVHFLFVGEGARRESLIAMSQRLQLRNVTFIGLVPLEEATQYLRLCDTILIPLKRTDQIEITLPGKIFEAAAMGKPIIVSAEGASADLTQRYGASLVVPPEDPKVLATAILQLRDDPALRQKLGECGLALAQDFDRERFARMMLEELQSAGPDRHQRRSD
jgi:glycosyltransferase involved in cell wall biosynthesis